MSRLLKYTAQPGEDIYYTAGRMISMARFAGCRVIATFNQYVLVADPAQTERDVLREWDAAQRRSYFGSGA